MNEQVPSIQRKSPSDYAEVRIEPGEQTTEHALTTTHNFQATILQILAGLSAAISGAIDLLQMMPASHRTLQIITIGGGIVTGIAQISKTIATARYTDGRSLIKAGLASLAGKQE